MPQAVPIHNPSALRLIVAADFNGVIHDHRGEAKGFCRPDSPVISGAIEWIREVITEYDLFLVSASFDKSQYVQAAKVWLDLQGIERALTTPKLIGRAPITLTPFKPPCLLFLDDRGFHFQGSFPDMEFIKTFTPWNR